MPSRKLHTWAWGSEERSGLDMWNWELSEEQTKPRESAGHEMRASDAALRSARLRPHRSMAVFHVQCYVL